VPGALTQQGRLFDASGAPLAGAATITFSISARIARRSSMPISTAMASRG
jgi:hypothetical protein